MSLTIDQICATKSDDALLRLLSAELNRLLPTEKQEDREWCYTAIESLPRGLRAMNGMYMFDASMTLDSLAWHFGNQNDERDLRETLNGLRELELNEIAEMFEQMWMFMKPHLHALQTGDLGGKDFANWLEEISAEKFADKKDGFIWAYCEKVGKLGLLAAWPVYARKYPGRCTTPDEHA